MMRTPIRASYWVVEGLLLAGEYPGSSIAEEVRPTLEELLDAGIRAFFDLTEPGELQPYEPILQDLARERGVDFTHERIPIQDVDVPEPSAVRALLARLVQNVEAGIPSYVHCWGGIGRTGTIIGCWLVQQGMSGDAALNHLTALRQHSAYRHRRSPETEEQCAFVRAWSQQKDAESTSF